MEGLNIALQEANNNSIIECVKLPNNGPVLSQLLYSDDALFVGNWSLENIKNLLRILRCFHLSSGLKVNLNKTKLFGVGVTQDTISWAASKIFCKAGTFLFSYLGIPLGAPMSRVTNWQPLLSKFESKLSKWKAATLSAAGRLVLCKSVLGSLGTYLFSIYKAPETILKRLEKYRKDFFWGSNLDTKKKIDWISWKHVMAKKQNGGLGVGSLKAQNISLLVKWWWRQRTDSDSIWKKVILSLHSFKRGQLVDPLNSKKKGVWGAIANIQTHLLAANLHLPDIFTAEQVNSQDENNS